MGQQIIYGEDSTEKIANLLNQVSCRKFLLVCDNSYPFLNIKDEIDSLPFEHVMFSGFTSNPLYEDVCEGVNLFKEERCDCILAIGGGSSIDVGKCIKLFCGMNPKENYLEQGYLDTKIPLIALPTTAGTGSESTRYAVIYYKGKKQSITHDSILPNFAVLDCNVLKTLPECQKKCTMLDALCQGIESWWSVNSTEESREYSHQTVVSIMDNWRAYLCGHDDAAQEIMLAANYSGKAINIAQTTAPHAMSYKLTSLYGLPHGHAVAICLPEVWEYMLGHMENCIDGRGTEYLSSVFADIAHALGCESPADAVVKFRNLLSELGMDYPVSRNRGQDLDILTRSVNAVRLKNNPVSLGSSTLRTLYEKVVRQ